MIKKKKLIYIIIALVIIGTAVGGKNFFIDGKGKKVPKKNMNKVSVKAVKANMNKQKLNLNQHRVQPILHNWELISRR